MFDVDGTFKDWQTKVDMDSTNLENSHFEVKVATKSVDTGIGERDNHLRKDDFFNAPRFPYARFKSEAIKRPQEVSYKSPASLRSEIKRKQFVSTQNTTGLKKLREEPFGCEGAQPLTGVSLTSTTNRAYCSQPLRTK